MPSPIIPGYYPSSPGYYRNRYDYRKNLMDADYNNCIKATAPIIHWQHYKEFGHTGVAFESRLANYNVPNRSLASYIDGLSKQKGTSVLVRGFWGDLVNSPYWAFGTDCDNARDKARLFVRRNEQMRFTAVDVAEFNLEALIRWGSFGINQFWSFGINQVGEFWDSTSRR